MNNHSIRDQLQEHRYGIEARRNWDREDSRPYFPHKALVHNAKLIPPRRQIPTVSSFADWVFSLYRPSRDLAALSFGKYGESELERKHKARRQLPIPPPENGWQLEYADPLDGSDEPFRISRLQLNGSPLRARPDLVYRQRNTGIRVVIERKTMYRTQHVPKFGWPNLKVQLWAYGHIDSWADAPEVYLSGRVYDLRNGAVWRTSTLSSKDPRLERECVELFDLFGGRVHGPQINAAVSNIPRSPGDSK